MLERSRVLTVALLAVGLALVAAGCNGDSAGTGTTPTGEPSATATAVPTGAPDIRDAVLTDQPGLSEFIAQTGGVVDTSRILYEDLTGSGADEAIVPVSSGGEGGDIAIFVFGFGDSGIEELLREVPSDSSIQASVEDGQLVTTQGAFAPGDPLCCPSEVLHRYYAWDGTKLVVDREEQVPAS